MVLVTGTLIVVVRLKLTGRVNSQPSLRNQSMLLRFVSISGACPRLMRTLVLSSFRESIAVMISSRLLLMDALQLILLIRLLSIHHTHSTTDVMVVAPQPQFNTPVTPITPLAILETMFVTRHTCS